MKVVSFLRFFSPYLSSIHETGIVSLYFGRNVTTRLGVAISEVYGPPVSHIKVEASR